jgi:ATP-binding cassette subfamily F protein uup
MFLFPPAVQHTPVSKLSGGERRRLQLLKVLVDSPNFLILDEPTNDLDIDTLNVLEEFLEEFSGCLLLVSHDRYFMDKLVNHLFVFEGEGEVRDFHGNYTDYKEKMAEIEDKKESIIKKETRKPDVKNAEPKPVATENRKLSYKEQREYDQLENDIADNEKKKLALTAKINGGSNDYEELAKWSAEIGELDKLIETQTSRWLELAELV